MLSLIHLKLINELKSNQTKYLLKVSRDYGTISLMNLKT